MSEREPTMMSPSPTFLLPDLLLRPLFSRLHYETTKRGPDQTIPTRDGRPYLRRWHITPRGDGPATYLHHFLASDDDRALHDHPWPSIGILLHGSYLDHMPGMAPEHAQWARGVVLLPQDLRELALQRFLADHGPAALVSFTAALMGMANSVIANHREMMELEAIIADKVHPHQAHQLNLPTLFGALHGVVLAARAGDAKMCEGCACRLGTAANQCTPTTDDVDYLTEGAGRRGPFLCHMEGLGKKGEARKVCGGYAALLKDRRSAGPSAPDLGRFGHHADPALDFCLEVEELRGIAQEREADRHRMSLADFAHRWDRAMDFRVGGALHAIAAKDVLRGLATPELRAVIYGAGPAVQAGEPARVSA